MNTIQLSHLRTYSDEDVMELFQGGYDEAFNEIVTRYRDRIEHFIFRYTRNQLDSEDLAQETFFRVYRSKHSYERIARFSTWLYTIANNLIRSHYRKSSRYQLTSIDEDDTMDAAYMPELADTSAAPDQQVHERQMIGRVERALQRIPSEFSEILVMREVQNLTYEEIMEITGLPMGTVKSRINRGRVRIQELVENEL